jgi:hypothetical protein
MRPGQACASPEQKPPLDTIFHLGYIPPAEWEIEYTDDFGSWWSALSEEEQIVIAAKVELLQKHGPTLPRPHSDVIVTSKHSNMKKLRGKAGESLLRVLYAFDPRRTAILLIGGDKSGSERWSEEFVPIADRLFDEHLAGLKRESRRRK